MLSSESRRHGEPAGRRGNRIDLHAHFVPGFYREALIGAGITEPDGIRAIPQWDMDTALRDMDRLEIETAMLSLSSPGVHFGDDERCRLLSRQINEEGARLMAAHPGRFGHFAVLPLPDVDRAVEEACYALDELGADGVTLLTNHRGLYLGDPRLDPLYAELDRRKSVMFVHPTSPACSCCPRLGELYPRPMLEFMFETTRSISDLILSGVLDRFPGIRVIVPHGGAVLPMLAERVELLFPVLGRQERETLPSIRQAIRSLHFDLAGLPVPHILQGLLALADHTHIHYGSDYPFTPIEACLALAERIGSTPLLDIHQRDGIWHGNSRKLFPRLATEDRRAIAGHLR